MATTTSLPHPTAVGGGLVVVGASFHYLGPSFAVLLFAHLDAMGVAWLRMATAALVLAMVRPPWTVWRAPVATNACSSSRSAASSRP